MCCLKDWHPKANHFISEIVISCGPVRNHGEDMEFGNFLHMHTSPSLQAFINPLERRLARFYVDKLWRVNQSIKFDSGESKNPLPGSFDSWTLQLPSNYKGTDKALPHPAFLPLTSLSVLCLLGYAAFPASQFGGSFHFWLICKVIFCCISGESHKYTEIYWKCLLCGLPDSSAVMSTIIRYSYNLYSTISNSLESNKKKSWQALLCASVEPYHVHLDKVVEKGKR